MILRSVFFLVLCLLCCKTYAQETIVVGKVTDAETGEAIPFATVFFKGTTVGAATDFDGFFKLKTTLKVDSVGITYVGYFPKFKAVRNGISQAINFQIQPSSMQLAEVVVTPGENPALRIIKNAVKNKEKNDLRNLTAYQCESFNKIEISIDNISEKLRNKRIMKPLSTLLDSINQISGEDGKPILPIFISESLSEFYSVSNPLKTKEYIKATKLTGVGVEDGTLISQLLGSTFQQYNFYENWNRILDKDFVSPIANSGQGYYIYTLRDTMFIDNHWCYEIQVNPKREQDLAFTGTIWIADTSFALKRVVLEIGKSANLNFIEKLKIQQELIPTPGGAWVPSKVRVLVDISELTENSAGMLAKFYSSSTNYVVNQPKPAKFYDDPIVLAEDAQNYDDAFWQSKRHEQLTEEEKQVYNMVDSLRNIPRIKSYIEYADIIVNGYKTIGKIDFGPYIFLYSNNSVEGHRFRVGAKTNVKFSRKWILKGYTAYGTKDKIFKYNAQVEYIVSRKPWTKTGFLQRDDIDPMGLNDRAEVSGDNLFSAISVTTSIKRFSRVTEYKYWFESEVKKGWSQRVFLHNKIFRPAGDYVFAYYTQPENIKDSPKRSVFTTTTLGFETRFAHNELFLQNDNERISLGTKKAPIFTLGYDFGFKGLLDGDFNYQKLSFRIEQSFNTGKLGNGSYNISTAKYFSELPYPALEILRGNQSFINNSTTYNLMDFFEFVVDEYVAMNYEQHFEGLLFNRLPAIKKLKWRTFAGGKGIYGRMSKKNFSLLPATDQLGRPVTSFRTLGSEPYLEVYYGVENIFKLLRVDFIHRLTYLDRPDTRHFGIKLSLQFTF